MKEYDIIVIGAGIAGLRAVEQIKQIAPEAKVALLSEEDRLPYKRTKLSKSIANGFTKEQFSLHDSEWYAESGVTLLTGKKATAVDTTGRSVITADGDSLVWKRLVITTGAQACFPDHYRDVSHHTVYFAADVEKIAAMAKGRALILGTGVLGIETADQLWRAGHEVTLTGMDARLMVKQLNEKASVHLRAKVESAGINIIRLSPLQGIDYQMYDSLTLCTGTIFRDDLDTGLDIDFGILVDQNMQSSHPHVFAGGDVAAMRDGYQSHLWHAAEHSGMAAGANAARSLLGEELAPYTPQPWRLKCEVFDQYYFSINYDPGEDESLFDIVEQEQGDAYRCFRFLEGRVHSIIMINEKDRAKWYQTAVQSGMEREKFLIAAGN